MIAFDFKFDLMEYLVAPTDSPVRSSGERKDLRESRILIRFYPIAHGGTVTVQLPETRALQQRATASLLTEGRS